MAGVKLAPVAETGFSNRLTAYKIVDISLDFHIEIYRGVIRSKIAFLESVTFQFHARMLSSEVAQSLKSYGDFSDLRDGVPLSRKGRHAGVKNYEK